jgi:PKD repeat protein
MVVSWEDGFCEGDSAWVAINPEGEAPFAFVWSTEEGDELISLEGDTLIFLSEGGEFGISELQDQYCASDSSLTFAVAEHLLPLVDAGPDRVICTGDTVSIGMEPTTGVNYTWTEHPGIFNPNASDPFFSMVNNGAFPTSIQLVLTAENANCAASDTVGLSVFPDPEIEAFIPDVICEGDTTEALAYGAPVYQWAPAAFFAIPDSSQTVFFPPPGEWEVSLIGVNEGGCSAELIQTVEVFPAPSNAFELSAREGCGPLEVVMSASVPQAGGSYVWRINGGNLIDNDPVVSQTLEAGLYRVELEVTNSEGCKNGEIYPDTIAVFGIEADFSFSPEQIDITDPTVRFEDLSEGSVLSIWSIDTVTSLTGNPISYSFPEDIGGTYGVCLTTISQEGCLDSLCRRVEVADDFFIYVPTAFTPDGDGINDLFYPKLSRIDVSDFLFRVYNRRGQVVFETRDPRGKWDGSDGDPAYFGRSDLYRWELQAKPDFNVETRVYSGTVMVVR